jgi:glucan phosphoethanolaminetransferase (alkaline phosphatase superfamily)
MVLGIVVGPITQLLLVSISAGMFYYIFKFYFHREVPYRQIYIHLVFATIPALLCNILYPVFPLAILVGGIGTCLLLFVGFTDNFHLDRVRTRNLLAALYAVLLISVVVQVVSFANKHERLREKATPESMDILEKEMNTDN